jgi:acetyl-CoA synthetase
MSSLLHKFTQRADFSSYDEFREGFRIKVPENFSFAYDVADAYADEYPDKIALVWCSDSEDKILTFGELKILSNKAANVFRKYGINKGDAVMLTLRSRWEFWAALVGLNKLGAVALPSSHVLGRQDYIYRIKKADLKMIVAVADQEIMDEFDSAFEDLERPSMVRACLGGPAAKKEGWIDFALELEKASPEFVRPAGVGATRNGDILLAYFTSGTAGHPKMVRHDQTYPLGHILTAKYWQQVEEDKLHYTVADTGWAKSAWGQIYGQWIAGAPVFIYDYDTLDARKMTDKMALHGVATFCAPLTIFSLMTKMDLSSYNLSTLKYAVTTGEPLTSQVYEGFLEATGLRLREGYGQTETVLVIANYTWMKVKPGSMGKPSPGYNVVLLDKDGHACDVGEEGEIAIEMPERKPLGLLTDYQRDGDGDDNGQANGYYRTGDTAWRDEDGYFWFVGRTDDLIKTSGYRVGPHEVESALQSHPAVLECAVTGVPDIKRGQVVKATIVLARGIEQGEDLKKELQAHVKKVTAPYKYPRIIEFRRELPKTISGKIRRVEIREKDRPYPAIAAVECKACERCILACPTNVLKMGMELNQRGYRYVTYSGDGCIGCGACYYTCPEPLAIEVHVPHKEMIEES